MSKPKFVQCYSFFGFASFLLTGKFAFFFVASLFSLCKAFLLAIETRTHFNKSVLQLNGAYLSEV